MIADVQVWGDHGEHHHVWTQLKEQDKPIPQLLQHEITAKDPLKPNVISLIRKSFSFLNRAACRNWKTCQVMS